MDMAPVSSWRAQRSKEFALYKIWFMKTCYFLLCIVCLTWHLPLRLRDIQPCCWNQNRNCVFWKTEILCWKAKMFLLMMVVFLLGVKKSPNRFWTGRYYGTGSTRYETFNLLRCGAKSLGFLLNFFLMTWMLGALFTSEDRECSHKPFFFPASFIPVFLPMAMMSITGNDESVGTLN